MKVVIISGLSGAGKTRAADWFEDQGYYCIDNMPPQLVKNFLELSLQSDNHIEKVAFVADVRGGEFFDELEACVDALRKMEGVDSTLLFVEASINTIVKRYNETRRMHPLTGGRATAKVIEEEKDMLEGVRNKADYILDTTHMKVSDFNLQLSKIILGDEGESSFNINLTSFGYKYGIPTESDIQVDMRFIPNPYYVKSLRKLTGNNKKVSSYVLKFDITQKFLKDFTGMVQDLVPGYIREGKYHLNIAVGCTGGHHRSVAVANELGRVFKEKGFRVTVTHRDLDFIAKGDKK
ncbi:MAG: RNase adapter RapZ [Eubacteriales bacterium]|nr:RNase adapter RapZ [Eubacteriales bacterium]